MKMSAAAHPADEDQGHDVGWRKRTMTKRGLAGSGLKKCFFD
jgi:hypothetical protein